MVSVPATWHKPADLALASVLVGGGIGMTVDVIQAINPWIALIGGIMGLIIGSVRVYEVVKPYFTKEK